MAAGTTDWIAWGPTLALLAACVAASTSFVPAWRAARLGAAAAGWLALAVAALAAVGPGPAHFGPQEIFGALVGFLGWVVTRFSARYLEGEPGERRYVTSLLATLAAVSALAATDHFGVLLAVWVATSVGLHGLLVFYPDRAAARIAAHKKFVASRLAEACLVVAAVLMHGTAGTLNLGELATYAAGRDSLPLAMHVAMVLVALAAVTKCAQVPVHGWLIQVMEAPTPVSALLHAGIVNVAGFVLIRMGELLALAPAARAVLVVVGGVSALLAGLVMLTRVSIKVRLAWSTCAQMGFMLVECGLGLYDLALLHLVAHSLYKAQAFLTAGETVAHVRQRDLWRAGRTNDFEAWRPFAALGVAAGLVWATVATWHWAGAGHVPGIAVVILATGLAPMLWHGPLAGALRIVGLASLYVVWHQLFTTVIPPTGPATAALTLFAAACFVALYFLQFWVVHRAASRIARALYPWAYCGFYADERFTRFALRLWPGALGRAPASIVEPHPVEETR